MTGMLVLQGGGAFVANDDLDRRAIAAAGADRVVVLPTADAFEQPRHLVETAIEWGRRLGVEIDPLMVLTRREADDEAATIVDGARMVVLAGDSSIHLRSVLKDTSLLAAVHSVCARGGSVVAVGSSAAAICDPMTDQRGGGYAFGLGLVAGLALITETERWPAEQLQRAHHLATTPVVDLPTGSAIVRVGGTWEIVGDAVVHGDLPA